MGKWKSHALRLGVALVAAAVLGGLAWGYGADGASAAGTGPRLVLNASGTGVTCDSSTEPSSCTAPLGGSFLVMVDFIDPPSGGYISVSSQVSLGGLVWTPAATADENVWPDNALPVRFPDPPIPGAQVLSHGGLTGTNPPFPASQFEGTVVQFTVSCPTAADSFELALVNYDATVAPLGAQYTDPNMTPVPSKQVGERDIDLLGDGNLVTVPVASVLDINCAVVPTATAPAGPTPTGGGGGAAATATVGALPSTGSGADSSSGTPWPVLGVLTALAGVLGLAGWQLRRGSAR